MVIISRNHWEAFFIIFCRYSEAVFNHHVVAFFEANFHQRRALLYKEKECKALQDVQSDQPKSISAERYSVPENTIFISLLPKKKKKKKKKCCLSLHLI